MARSKIIDTFDTYQRFSKPFFKEVAWAVSSVLSSTWLVITQVLEEVDASLLEQQGKESNSSHDVPTL